MIKKLSEIDWSIVVVSTCLKNGTCKPATMKLGPFGQDIVIYNCTHSKNEYLPRECSFETCALNEGRKINSIW